MRKHPNLNPQRAVSSAAGKEDDVSYGVKHPPCPRTPGKKKSEVEVLRAREAKLGRRFAKRGLSPAELQQKERILNRLQELGAIDEAF